MVVVPTLLLSESNCAKLIKDLEIRYLANRGRNLFFALLTDFPDASTQETAGDSVLRSCADGIRQLNARYDSGGAGPFYLMHRARRWNSKERKWMGYERKRGKLNDLNKLLLGRGNWFDTIVGAPDTLRDYGGYRHAAPSRHGGEDGGGDGPSVEPAGAGCRDEHRH
jgi:hypothetical protein